MNILFLFVLLSIVSCAFGQEKSGNNFTANQWQNDLLYLAKELPEKHKNAFHSISKHQFDSAVTQLNKKIPSLKSHEIVVELMRLVAMIGDGHTRLRLEQYAGTQNIFPLRLYQFKDGLFVQAAADEYKEIVGCKVIGIGNLSTETAIKEINKVAWHDNKMGMMTVTPTLVSIPVILHALKIIDDTSELKLSVLKEGKTKIVSIAPTGLLFHLFQPPAGWKDAQAGTTPLWMKDPHNNFWCKYLPDSKVFYVQYNAVRNKPGETVEAFFKMVLDSTKKVPAEKLVIDLRNNGGGNNTLNRPFIIELIKSDFNQKGKLFAIIGRHTFSAAQNAVNELEKYTEVIFVGEPTGARPNHYGDAENILLPNSKIPVTVSTLWWQDMDPRDTRKWTAPAIAAELTSEDYKNGRDPAMEAILNYNARPVNTNPRE